MRALIGCEYTGTGQQAFTEAGWDAWSCDLDPTEGDPKRHIRGDIIKYLESVPDGYYDLIILHPDCTAMGVCGNGTYGTNKDGTPKEKHHERIEAVDWTVRLWNLAKKKGKRVCLENPASVIFPVLRKLGALVQYVQPWWFGHPETKKTGLALHNLEPLIETDNVYEYMMTLPPKERHKIWYASPSKTRGKDRSRSYPGMLKAMAHQWGNSDKVCDYCSGTGLGRGGAMDCHMCDGLGSFIGG